MASLVLKMSVSLDGYVAPIDGSTDWVAAGRSDDGASWTVETLSNAGAHLIGATTYAGWAAYWPGASGPFAKPMNEIPKVVFSDSFALLCWRTRTYASRRPSSDRGFNLDLGASLINGLGVMPPCLATCPPVRCELGREVGITSQDPDAGGRAASGGVAPEWRLLLRLRKRAHHQHPGDALASRPTRSSRLRSRRRLRS